MAKIADVLDKLEQQNTGSRKEYSDEDKAKMRASLAQSIDKLRATPKHFGQQLKDAFSFIPQQPDPMSYLQDLEEIESPFPEINEHLRNMATSMENLHQEQIKENQQAKSTKRIAIATLIVAVIVPILISLLTTNLGNRVMGWSNLVMDWFTST